mmetsp:Transcript_79252/g.256550  ORF Transcript_79252/g.256550 Transcript_79252/m.256550 type:complete len:514 (+) Transcript_79252:114-1655(+)
MALAQLMPGDGMFDETEGYVDVGDDASGASNENDYNDNELLEQEQLHQDAFAFGDTGRASPQEGPSKPQRSSESRERWERKTLDGLSNAKALTKHALKSITDNDSVHGHTKRQLHANTNVVHHTIRKKIVGTEDMVKALDDRVESVEDTMRQVGECLFQLQRAHRSKWSPLNVCERRLQLRDARPVQELIRDACQEALERERQTLIESRQELADQIDSMKEMLISLDKVKGDLVEDMQHKRHALRIDRFCLSPKKPVSARQIQDRLVLPALQEVVHYGLPPSPKDTEVGTGQQHEEVRQLTAKELIAKAVQCEEEAMRLCNESDAVMIHTKRECTRASNQAQAELTRRVDETCQLKRQLEAQIHEMDQAITQTELSLAKTKKKLESHEQPLRALDKQFAMRGARTSREGIRDAVHEEMEGHLDTVKKNVKALTEKFQHTREILEQLRSTRQHLQEDYRGKSVAQKIDDACIKVTPKKAIELDRSDPRGGRCREPSGRRRQRDYGAEPALHDVF